MDSGNKEGMPNWLLFLISAVGVVYLLNPTLGFFELIPDNLPIIGNLDEGAAALLVWEGINRIRQNRQSKK